MHRIYAPSSNFLQTAHNFTQPKMVANSRNARAQRMNTREGPTGLRRGNSACGKAPSPPLPTVPEALVLPPAIRFEDGSIGFRQEHSCSPLNFLPGDHTALIPLIIARVPCGFLFYTVTKHGKDFDVIHTAIKTEYGAILDAVKAKYGLPFTDKHVKVLCEGFLHNDTCSRVDSLNDMLAKHDLVVSPNSVVQLAMKGFNGSSLLTWKPTPSVHSFPEFCARESIFKLDIPVNELQALEALRATEQRKAL